MLFQNMGKGQKKVTCKHSSKNSSCGLFIIRETTRIVSWSMLRLLEKVLKMEKGMKDGWLKVINLLLLQAEHDVIIKLQSCKEINFSLDNDFSIRTFLWGVWMNNLAKQPPLQNDL